MFSNAALLHRSLCIVCKCGQVDLSTLSLVGDGHPAPGIYSSRLISITLIVDNFYFIYHKHLGLDSIEIFHFCLGICSHDKNMLFSFILFSSCQGISHVSIGKLAFPENSTVSVEIKLPSCKH